MQSLLTGLIVVEASRDVAIRYCGRLFAQMGAAVVRAPGGDDSMIGYAGEAGEAYGRWLDAGKLEARPERADLVIAGLGGQQLMDGQDVAEEFSALRLELRWFQADGPYAAWRGSDELIQALSGLAYPFGPIEGPPTLAQGHGPQIAAGLVGFNAAMGALIARERPRKVEVNVFEAYMCLTETGAVSALMEGGGSVRLGVNRFVPTYPSASYRSADGWVGLTALTPSQWRGFCRMLGDEAFAADPRFTTSVERLLLADEVDAFVTPRLLTRTTDAWMRLALEARVPLTPMPDLAQLPQTPHWRERGSFAAFDASGRPAPTMPARVVFSGQRGAAFEGGAIAAPLKGLRVVDFSMGWAGPLCARTLGDLGAEVIKIESESHPDWWRGWESDQSGDPPPWETKFSFISMNRNKRAITLELATPEGLAHAKALVARADIVVENFAAGILEGLGLGPTARAALNPDLITLSMPAFGNGGPLSGIRAYGSTVEQACGMPFANGHDDWPPCMQHVAFGDPIVGLYAAGAALAALWARGRKGGAEIDLAQVACLFQFAADALIAQQFRDTPLPRTGSRRPRAAPVCVLACAEPDTWLAVAADADAWGGLCMALEQPEWAKDPDLATPEGRNAQADKLEATLAAWAATRTTEEATEWLQMYGVPAAPVQKVEVLGYDPQLTAGGFWTEMDRRYVGRHLMPAAPFAYDEVRPALIRPAPTLGEHTAEVLAELDAAAQVT